MKLCISILLGLLLNQTLAFGLPASKKWYQDNIGIEMHVKDKYLLLGERVTINVKIWNKSEENIWLPCKHMRDAENDTIRFPEISYWFKNTKSIRPYGSAFGYVYDYPYPLKKDSLLLKPRDTVSANITLLPESGYGDLMYPYFETGKTYIEASINKATSDTFCYLPINPTDYFINKEDGIVIWENKLYNEYGLFMTAFEKKALIETLAYDTTEQSIKIVLYRLATSKNTTEYLISKYNYVMATKDGGLSYFYLVTKEKNENNYKYCKIKVLGTNINYFSKKIIGKEIKNVNNPKIQYKKILDKIDINNADNAFEVYISYQLKDELKTQEVIKLE